MHLKVLPPKDRDLRGFLHCPVQKKQMGITKCCTFFPFDVKLESPLTAHASATTCLGTGKSVGVLCKTTQKRTQWNYNELH